MVVVLNRRCRSMRTATLLLAAVLAVTGLLAAPVGAKHYERTVELQASSNVQAAIAWSRERFANGQAQEALLGRDDAFPDNLASGLLQGPDTPLLLTARTTLSAATRAELQRLGVRRVTILGGERAVGRAVATQLREAGYEVDRLQGATRIETAVAVAATRPGATTAIVARAYGGADETQGFADSLAAGGWAADAGLPVLLTHTARLSASTRDYLQGSLIQRVFVVGGPAAVSPQAEQDIRSLGKLVTRVAGSNRFETAVAVAQARGLATAGAAAKVLLAEGGAPNAWASGFSAAAASAAEDAPIVLAAGTKLPDATASFLGDGRGRTALTCGPFTSAAACTAAAETLGLRALSVRISLVTDRAQQGGTVSGQISTGDRGLASLTVSGCGLEPVRLQVNSERRFSFTIPDDAPPGSCQLVFNVALDGGSTETISKPFLVTTRGASVTDGPELQAVRFVDGDGDRVRLRFVFDEPVSGAASAVRERFRIYDIAAVQTTAIAVAFDPADARAVIATFPAPAFAEATTATVAHAAVQDGAFELNPEGAAGLKAVTTGTGRTQAADLLAVEAFRSGGSRTLVDFSFDAEAFTVSDGYRLVRPDATVVACVRHTGQGATTPTPRARVHTVSCPGTLGTANVARGFVASRTVSDLEPIVPGQVPPGGKANPQQAVPVSGEGRTGGPDLVAVDVNPDNDTVIFGFDENVSVTGSLFAPNTRFRVYRSDGSEVSSLSATRSGTNAALASFPSGSLDRLVAGVSVDADAVRNVAGEPNQVDGRGLQRVFAAGQTAAPALLSAARQASGSGDDATVRVVYTFDAPVRTTDVVGRDLPGGFAVHEADNSRVVIPGDACAVSAQDARKVICSVGVGAATYESVRSAVLAVVQHDSVRDGGRRFANHEAGARL